MNVVPRCVRYRAGHAIARQVIMPEICTGGGIERSEGGVRSRTNEDQDSSGGHHVSSSRCSRPKRECYLREWPKRRYTSPE